MQLRKSKKTRCSGNSSMNSKSEEISKTADEPHQVIRTKAVRCTKVVIPELLNYNQTMDTNVGENSQSSSALQEDNNSASHDLLMNFDISELLVWDDAYLSSSSGSLQANNHEINNNEDGDHHHDRNMADGNLDVDHHDQMIKNMTSCFPECYDSVPDQAMFEDLILDGRTRPENWTDIDSDHFQNNIDTMDLKSLAVFLDSED
ncbi:hypothetical protein JRO89_XS04G0197700 [Xanthoceras sorbifolium]|uniref:Uncharacterized protein n=1 Tax=Xanthoceras sorbifolium TaxID=99658 RepID=A0ABQ8I614_9ROSI|nr:hypothetical protein JRO89_XS04G0197700 [Xanthoceras sorbifolium]